MQELFHSFVQKTRVLYLTTEGLIDVLKVGDRGGAPRQKEMILKWS